MSQFDSIGELNSESAYRQSFANLPSGTCYVDPTGAYNRVGVKSDLRESFNNVVKTNLKALDTNTGSGSTDRVMIPIYVDPKVVDLTRKQTPIVDVMPRVSNLGRTADFNQISAKGGAFFAAEDAAFVSHSGFDWQGIRVAMEKNLEKGRIAAGGSGVDRGIRRCARDSR